jgi:CHASE2 domain-containing sensor protein
MRRAAKAVRRLDGRLAALSRTERAGLVTLLAPLLGAALAFVVYAREIEDWSIKHRLRARPATPLSGELVLIGVDERVAERTPAGAPTPKLLLADLLRTVSRYRPSVVALNYRLGPVEEAEPGFARLVQAADSAAARGTALVLPAAVASRGPAGAVVYRPSPGRFPRARVGYTSLPALAPGRGAAAPAFARSDAPLFLRIRHLRSLDGTDELAPSFALVAVAAHRRLLRAEDGREALTPAAAARVTRGLGAAPRGVGDTAAVARAKRPRLLGYSAPVPVPGAGVSYYAADDFLAEAAAGAIPPEWLRNRLVVIAAVSVRGDEADVVETPFGPARGGVVLLHAMDDLLRGVRVVQPAWPWVLLLSAAAFGTMLALWRRSAAAGVAVGSMTGAAYALLAFLLAQWHVLLPLAWPAGAGLLAAVLGFIFQAPARSASAAGPAVLPLSVLHPARPAHSPAAAPAGAGGVAETARPPRRSGSGAAMMILAVVSALLFLLRKRAGRR